MLDTLPFGAGLSVGAVSLAAKSKYASVRDINKFLYAIIIAQAGAGDLTVRAFQAKDKLGTGEVALGIERVFNKDADLDKWVQDMAVTNELPAALYDSATAALSGKTHMMVIQIRPHDLLCQQGYNQVAIQVVGGSGRTGMILFQAEGSAYEARDLAGLVA